MLKLVIKYWIIFLNYVLLNKSMSIFLVHLIQTNLMCIQNRTLMSRFDQIQNVMCQIQTRLPEKPSSRTTEFILGRNETTIYFV